MQGGFEQHRFQFHVVLEACGCRGAELPGSRQGPDDELVKDLVSCVETCAVVDGLGIMGGYSQPSPIVLISTISHSFNGGESNIDQNTLMSECKTLATSVPPTL
jgi:hypothetical protein